MFRFGVPDMVCGGSNALMVAAILREVGAGTGGRVDLQRSEATIGSGAAAEDLAAALRSAGSGRAAFSAMRPV